MTSPSSVVIPDQLKGRGFRFTRLSLSRMDGKAPIDPDFYGDGALTEDDPSLLAHIEAGNGYGLATNYGDLMAFDADEAGELEVLGIMARLPATLTDRAPHKPESSHLYYVCPGIPKTFHFYHPTKTVEKVTGEATEVERLELGQVCAGRGHIVGPNSPHHKGGRRKIVDDSPLTEITVDDLRGILRGLAFSEDPTKNPSFDEAAGLVEKTGRWDALEEITRKARRGRRGDGPSLSERIGDIRRVLDTYGWSPTTKSGDNWKGDIPGEVSKSKTALAVDIKKGVWYCHHHADSGGDAAALVALFEGLIDCRGKDHLRDPVVFQAVIKACEEKGLIDPDEDRGGEERSARNGDGEAGGTGKVGGSVATRIVDLAISSGATFWRTTEGELFATIPNEAGHEENHPLKSKAAKTWLSGLLFKAEGKAPKGSAAADALAVLESMAIYGGKVHPVYVRFAEYGDKFYLDLGGDDWRAVEIDSKGWRVIPSEDVPIKFRRSKGIMALPEPAKGGDLEDLRRVLNVPEGPPWVLVRAWLAQAVRPTGPYPVLIVDGEQGSGKSWLGRILRYVIDPNKAPLRRPPRSEHDLMIAAANSWLVVYDNLSGLPGWLGDALCVVSTGGGLSCRELYTDSEEALFDLQRPVILNGIDAITTRGDLLGRAIVLHLPRIKDEDRRTEKAILAELDRIRPSVLGAILDVISSGLRELPNVRLDSMPRMADFAEWATACEGALGLEPGEFLAAFEANRTEAEASLIGADFFATSLVEFINGSEEPFEGTAGFLLAALGERAGIALRGRPDGWPRTPQGAGNKIRRLAPALRAVGIEVSYRTGHGNVTLITIQRHKTTMTTKTTVSSGAKSISSDPPGGDGGIGGLHSATSPPIPPGGLSHPLPISDPQVKKEKELEKREERGVGREVRKRSPPRPPSPPDSGFRGGLGGLGGLCDELEEVRRREAEDLAKFATPEPKPPGGELADVRRPKKDGLSSVDVHGQKEEEGRGPAPEEAAVLEVEAGRLLENWPGLPETKLWERARERLGRPLPIAVVRRWLRESGYVETGARGWGGAIWNPPPASEGVTA